MPSNKIEKKQSLRKLAKEEWEYPWAHEEEVPDGGGSPDEADKEGEQDGDGEGYANDGEMEEDGEGFEGEETDGFEQEPDTSPPTNDGGEYPDGEIHDGEDPEGENAEEESLDGELQDGANIDGEITPDAEQEISSVDSIDLQALTHVNYVIGIPPNSRRAIMYIRDLEASMDVLATQVGETLGANVQVPSKIGSILQVDCPSFVDPSDKCKHVEAYVELEDIGMNTAEFEALSDGFHTKLTSAIEHHGLQEALDVINVESKVYIVTGIIPTTQNADDTDGEVFSGTFPATKDEKFPQGIQKGAFIGMAAAGLSILLLIFAYVLHWRRRRRSMEKENDESLESTADGQSPSSVPAASSAEDGNSPDFPVTLSDGCARQNYEYDGGYLMDEVSSIASSSVCYGPYSSSLGPASLQFGDALQFGDDYRNIILSQGSRDINELDDAIRNGDWRTTGDTAAILAEDSSYASSVGWVSLGQNMQSLVNPDMVADLDKWIEAGDWQEIVNAANRYESEKLNTNTSYLPAAYQNSSLLDDDVESRVSTSSSSKISLVSIVESVHTALGYESAFEDRSLALRVPNGSSDIPTGRNRKQEIHDEITVLVRDFLPEEIESIEELMFHFEGKEEELLHTVKTMQSRYATQQARLARKTPPTTVIAPDSAVTTRTHRGDATSALGNCAHDDSSDRSEFSIDKALAPSSVHDAF